MTNINIRNLAGGYSLKDFLRCTTIGPRMAEAVDLQDALSVLEGPFEKYGDKWGGFIQYEDVRLGYDSENRINEVCLYFTEGTDLRFQEVITKTGEQITIDFSTTLVDFIRWLNGNKITWSARGNGGWGITLLVNNIYYATFDIDDGCLVRIFLSITPASSGYKA